MVFEGRNIWFERESNVSRNDVDINEDETFQISFRCHSPEF